MSSDLDWVDPEGTDVLTEALRGMVHATPLESPTGPAAALGTIRSRVRRRRAVKQTAIGAGSLAFAGATALAASELATWAPAPLPEPAQSTTAPVPTPSPTPRPTPSLDPSPVPTAAALPVDVPIEVGYQPAWLAGTSLECGMPLADLPQSMAGFRLALAGAPVDWYPYTAAPVQLAVTGDSAPEATWSQPSLVWLQNGYVVDLGDVVDRERPVVVEGLDLMRGDAEDDMTSSCVTAQDADPYLPAGEYQVVALSRLMPGDASPDGLLLSAPVTVTIEPGGHVMDLGQAGAPSGVGLEGAFASMAVLGNDELRDGIVPGWSSGLVRGPVVAVVEGRCLAPGGGELSFEVVTGGGAAEDSSPRASGTLACDGARHAVSVDLPAGPDGEPWNVAVWIVDRPDDAVRAYVTLEPEESDG